MNDLDVFLMSLSAYIIIPFCGSNTEPHWRKEKGHKHKTQPVFKSKDAVKWTSIYTALFYSIWALSNAKHHLQIHTSTIPKQLLVVTH